MLTVTLLSLEILGRFAAIIHRAIGIEGIGIPIAIVIESIGAINLNRAIGRARNTGTTIISGSFIVIISRLGIILGIRSSFFGGDRSISTLQIIHAELAGRAMVINQASNT